MWKPAKLTDDQKRSVLNEVLAGGPFKGKPQQCRLLKYLVEEEIRGTEVTEYSAGVECFKIREFQSDLHSNVRVTMNSLRGSLEAYYSREGKNARIRLTLPKGQYTPLFVEWQEDEVLLGFEPQQPSPPRGGAKKPSRGKRVAFSLFSLVVVALGSGVWSFYDRACEPSITLLVPGHVHTKETVDMTRGRVQTFCRCEDYLVVEPSGLDQQMWVQGRFTGGLQSHLTATFGEPDTPAGTRFTVFVLTTKNRLRTGLLSGPSPQPADAIESQAVEVILDKP